MINNIEICFRYKYKHILPTENLNDSEGNLYKKLKISNKLKAKNPLETQMFSGSAYFALHYKAVEVVVKGDLKYTTNCTLSVFV